MSRPRRGLLTRFVLAMVAAGVAAAIAGAVLLGGQARSSLTGQIAARNEQVSRDLARSFDDRVAAVADALRAVAATETIVQPDHVTAADLDPFLTVLPQFERLIVFDRDGRAVVAAAPNEFVDAADLPDRPGVADRSSGFEVAIVPARFPSVEITVPIVFPAGRSVGAVVARVPLSALSLPIVSMRLEDQGIAYLVGGDGALLAHVESDRVIRGERVDTALLPEPGRSLQRVTDGPDARLLAATGTRSLPGAVVVDQPLEDAVGALTGDTRRLVAILVLIVGVTVAAAALTARWLLRPLRQLSEAARRVAGGERGIQLRSRSFGELGIVLDDFNAMARSLDAHVAELEGRNEELAEARAVLEQRVAELTRARADLAVSEERFERVFELAPLAMTLVDPRGRFLRINPAATEVLGRSHEQLLRLGPLDLAASGEREVQARHLRALLSGAVPTVAFEARYRRGEGGTVWCSVIGAAVVDEEGVEYAYLQFEDITSRKRAEQALTAAYEHERSVAAQLREVDEMKNAFLAAVSHELRTPLAIVRTVAEELMAHRDRLGAPEVAELIDPLRRNARRLHHLLEDLMDVERLRRGVLRPERRTAHLPTHVHRVVADVDGLGRRAVSVDVDDVHASVDITHLERIVHNLLANAVKHTPEGSRIDVAVHRIDDRVEVTVEDRGPGVPDPLKTVIFEPFRRGPDAPRHQPGTGIGLALVHQFARLHGGRVWVEDRPGGGARFRVVLREAPPSDAPKDVLGE